MLNTTIERLRCPKPKRKNQLCGGALDLQAVKKTEKGSAKPGVFEIQSGSLRCKECKARFPILGGVALLVQEPGEYILAHVKGIAQVVPDQEIPEEFHDEYFEAKEQIEIEHIEEDLEAQRVTALYLMNHYLRVENGGDWWKPRFSAPSPLIDQLVRDYWDRGPFAQIRAWMEKQGSARPHFDAIELGCGVGGLHAVLKSRVKSYLGVDSSFASIALARHLALGVEYPGKLSIPEDLLQGPVARPIDIQAAKTFDGHVDFVVGELQDPPLALGQWDLTIALNTIDMLEEPASLPKLQHGLLKDGGLAIQSCPYIWHEVVARKLRSRLPKAVRDSAAAVEWLYEQAQFKIEERADHLPWLFFKHVRQLEIYSVHAFVARKRA